MEGYIVSIVTGIIGGEMLLMLLPEGGMKKFARVTVGITVAAMLLSPLRDIAL